MYPDAQLVSTLQRDHLSLRGSAQVRDRRAILISVVVQAAVGLHHSLLLLVRLVLPHLDHAGQRDARVSSGEGHPGVDVVVTRLLDGQPDIVVVADVPTKRVPHVPLDVISCRDREGFRRFVLKFLQVAHLKMVERLTCWFLCLRSLLDHHACQNSSGRYLFLC